MIKASSIDGIISKKTDVAGFNELFASRDGWCVGMLNGGRETEQQVFERHPFADELFVLLSGSAAIKVASCKNEPDKMQEIIHMRKGELIIVNKAYWHTLLLSNEAKVLTVERNPNGIAGFTERMEPGSSNSSKKVIIEKTIDGQIKQRSVLLETQ
ncbi:MAG: cupin domain-containing protein, partial [Planctomycetota bacterium]|jgi:mannose-6-phosphate isomerase-like protein (cupin superfamily)